MEIRLSKLTLKNFKGVKKLVFEPSSKNANIKGDNATGKTTVFDAFSWLLFDKDSEGKKDFGIKPLDENNQPIHNLETEVEGVLSVDGKPLTLRKVFAEKPDEFDPRKYLGPARDELKKLYMHKNIEVLGSAGKA